MNALMVTRGETCVIPPLARVVGVWGRYGGVLVRGRLLLYHLLELPYGLIEGPQLAQQGHVQLPQPHLSAGIYSLVACTSRGRRVVCHDASCSVS